MLGIGNAITSGSTTKDLLTMTTDLELWLKNSSGVTAAEWKDSSGNNNHATQGTGGNQATLSGGGLDYNYSERYFINNRGFLYCSRMGSRCKY